MNTEKFYYEDIRDIQNQELREKTLEDFYRDIMIVFFPTPEQLDPIERIRDSMDPKDETYYTSLVHVVVCYNGKREMIGGTLFEVFPNSESGLLSYFCVKQEYRKNKLGKILIDKATSIMDADILKMKGKECDAIYFETNSPLKHHHDDDTITPENRLRVLKNLGCDLINFEFVQPPLEPNMPIDTNLVLLYYNRDNKKNLDGNKLLLFMKEYWEITEAPLNHPIFLNTIKVLQNKSISLLPLTIENIRNLDYSVSGLPPAPEFHLEKKKFNSNL
eukprot:TRINITY_DN4523_c0_g1_i1.p1 TRINITY_DN4523_c0_g1~~TRINITY_DN4523_c0_g1_i1.p1  ORF type:complete len:275 (+),score=75.72 TRINITY_DN4523_c0_g1_i1:436-1260(+)